MCKILFQNSILFWKYKIVFYFVFLKYSYQCILFCIFKILFSTILLFSKYFFENTFCKGQTKGTLISDRDPQLSMSLSCRSAVQNYFILKSILKILFYFVFSKYFLGVFCTSLLVFGVSCVYLWVSCIYLGCCRFVLSVPQPSDWLERLVSEWPIMCRVGR